MLRFLQTYKSKKEAGADWKTRVRKAEADAESAQLVLRAQLDEQCRVVEHAFREAAKIEARENKGEARASAPSKDPRLRRENFLRCLNVPRANLERHMINMIAARVNQAEDGTTPTKGFRDIVRQCHFDNCKRQILEAQPSSSLESHVRQILEAKEAAFRDEGVAGDGHAKLLPAKQVYDALFQAKHLHLTRQQLLAVMSLQDECVAAADDAAEVDELPDAKLLDVVRFAAEATTMIADFFDVGKMKRRAALSASVKATAVELLKGSRAEDLEEKLASAFEKYDPEGSGIVALDDFRTVISGITVLDLSRSEISSVLTNAPTDDRGRVVWGDFLLDARDVFSLLAQERHMRRLHEAHGAHFDTKGDVQPLDREQVEKLFEALAEASSLGISETDPGAFKVAFAKFEAAAAPAAADGAGGGLLAQMAGQSRRKSIGQMKDDLADDPWGRSDGPVYARPRRKSRLDDRRGRSTSRTRTYPRRGRGISTPRPRNIHAAAAEYPRRGRGVAATRLRGRRDPPPQKTSAEQRHPPPQKTSAERRLAGTRTCETSRSATARAKTSTSTCGRSR